MNKIKLTMLICCNLKITEIKENHLFLLEDKKLKKH